MNVHFSCASSLISDNSRLTPLSSQRSLIISLLSLLSFSPTIFFSDTTVCPPLFQQRPVVRQNFNHDLRSSAKFSRWFVARKPFYKFSRWFFVARRRFVVARRPSDRLQTLRRSFIFVGHWSSSFAQLFCSFFSFFFSFFFLFKDL